MLFHKLLLILTILLFGVVDTKIELTSDGTNIKVSCNTPANVTIKRDPGTDAKATASSSLTVSKASETNFLEYSCTDNTGHRAFIFIKLCRNCVDIEPGTIVGIVIGDLVATILIAVAVYFISIPAKVKIHQASDRQMLVLNEANNALYSGINESERQPYSSLGHRKK
uniref:T-cell surface glycoprotein CD3 delta chain-like isoform X1 n=1 Tax=Pristiophorus japonicus TaxID=55135 RepID=UPI00398EDBB4